MNPRKNRVVILGGGVIGLCSAYYALQRGFQVTVIEREAAGGDNCSMGNAGMIVPSHFIPLAAPGMISKGLRWMINPESPFYVRPRVDLALARWGWLFYRHSTARHVEQTKELLRDLNLESRRLFAELSAEEDFGLQKRGMLMLCKTAKGLDEEAEVGAAAREIGLEAEVLDAAAAAKLDPGITMDIAGAVYFPQDCHLDPARFMASLRKRVIALGGQIQSGVEIGNFELKGGSVTAITGKGHRFEGDEFVLAGGSWTPELMKKLGIHLPLQAGKGYSLTLPNPPELPQVCSIFVEAKVAITPMDGKLRFAGTMEVGGLDLSINPARVRGIVKSVHSYFPKFSEADFEGVKPWAGLRPVSPDGIPYLGRPDGIPNLVVASGHAMMGLSLGPVSGRLVADLLDDAEPFRPIEQMAVGRF
ncbi:FAD-dependent oxidoreductase [Luteolibacter sp. GHJ8]|uniref:FAD-dependent oxidoreductase n=1 Tax=Luteolibacter rhizosphaerae TaxID=2989719 RepID=A0ABT3FYB2_9BACT|nr:FAD-dependent oxidoreductase [Luteolibacter rhizosphaerae]MCW1912309.1 FAD-dependent oxidoreductase [Luteolibacter rhizosphaerae]